MKYLFKIQGSSDEPYNVAFFLEEGNFKAVCDCPAGLLNTLCKHVITIIDGNVPASLVAGNSKAIPEIVKAFQNSEAGLAYKNFRETEAEVEKLKKEVKNRKKQVARLLYQ